MRAFIAIVLTVILVVVLLAMATGCESEAKSDQATAASSTTPMSASQAAPARVPPPSTGPMAPDFQLAMGNGTTVRLSDLKGKVVVLDFWATWCGPCKAILPQIDAFSKWAKESGEPIEVYAVHTMEKSPREDTINAVAAMWQKQGYSTLVLFDFGASVARQFGVRGIPQTFVIGTDGRIFAQHSGFVRGKDMTAELRQECLRALGEPSMQASSAVPANH